MTDVQRCTRCILPESLPSVKLDKDGVCNHCRTYNSLYGNWEDVKSQRQEQFEKLLQRAKGLKRNYDCVIPLSGGKDSTYALYLCDKVYKLKCLCVTFDNGFLSEHARLNIKNAMEATNADHMFYGINRRLMLELYRTFLIKCGNFCPACMRGIGLVGQISEYFKIPIGISGTGRRVAYWGFIPELFQGGNTYFFKNIIRGEPISQHVGPMSMDPLSWKIKSYITLACRALRVPSPILGQHMIGLYDYIYIPFDEIQDTLKKEMGWEKSEDKSEHMDCTIHDIAFYIHTLKFPELTNTTFYHSGLIRLGLMTREEAISTEKNKLGNPHMPKELDSFLDEIRLSRDEFESSVKDWRNINKFRTRTRNMLRNAYLRMGGE